MIQVNLCRGKIQPCIIQELNQFMDIMNIGFNRISRQGFFKLKVNLVSFDIG